MNSTFFNEEKLHDAQNCLDLMKEERFIDVTEFQEEKVRIEEKYEKYLNVTKLKKELMVGQIFEYLKFDKIIFGIQNLTFGDKIICSSCMANLIECQPRDLFSDIMLSERFKSDFKKIKIDSNETYVYQNKSLFPLLFEFDEVRVVVDENSNLKNAIAYRGFNDRKLENMFTEELINESKFMSKSIIDKQFLDGNQTWIFNDNDSEESIRIVIRYATEKEKIELNLNNNIVIAYEYSHQTEK